MNELLLKALNLCYFYLKIRPRTEKEIVDYLVKKSKKHGFSEELIQQVVDDLKSQRLIDDKQFVKWYIEDKIASKKKSIHLLKFELQKHGVEQDIVQRYVEFHQPDQFLAAKTALRSKWKQYNRYDEKTRFQRAAAFLQRKGFSYDVIKKAIAEFQEKE